MDLFSEYLRKEGLLSRIDVRVKLILSLLLLLMVLSNKGLFFPIFIALTSLLICLYMRIPGRVLLLRFSEPLFIATILLILKLFYSGKEELFHFYLGSWRVVGYRDGLMDGLTIYCRIMGSVSLIALLGFVTPFTEFIAGLSWFRIPRLFIEILMLTYRYIFLLLEDARIIYNAQKNRLGYSGIRRGLSSFGTLAGALTLRAFEHSQRTAQAMSQRGYTGSIPLWKQEGLDLREIIGAALILIAMAVLWKI